MYNITIIGGGVVGCAIAYELTKAGHTGIVVLERNETIPGVNQSSTNEGSIHSGVYYPSDIMPLKSSLCVTGNRLMYEFLDRYNLPYTKAGKLIVATTDQEESYLDFFLSVGLENEVPGIRKISGVEAMSMEPNLANVTSALHVPSTGCTSPDALIKKLKQLGEENEVIYMTGTKLETITPQERGFHIEVDTTSGPVHFDTSSVINSAGLYADEIAKLINPDLPYVIDPIRGEFYRFNPTARPDISMNGMHIYQPPYCYTTENGILQIVDVPVADLRKRLKEGNIVITAGVHLSPAYDTIDGTYVMDKVTISPLKTSGVGKDDYTENLHTAEEFIQKIHHFFPNLTIEDIVPDHTGIMCPLKHYRDFVIERDKKYPNCINLIGMESPAWTACLAIAKYVTDSFFTT